MPIFFAVAEYLSNMFYLSKNVILEVPAKCQEQISIHYILSFLGPRGPLVLPLVDPPAHPYAMKIWTPIYRHICLMNHQETPQTNPLAIWDPLDVSLNPLGPPGTPWPPPSPPWDPKRDLLASLNSKNHLNCLTYHLRTPSNFPVDPRGHLKPSP